MIGRFAGVFNNRIVVTPSQYFRQSAQWAAQRTSYKIRRWLC
jgi:hypothetical protein